MDAEGGTGLLWLVYAPPLVIAVLGYLGAVGLIHRRGDRWPLRRTLSWCAGLLAAAIAVTGAGHDDFAAHMTGHLLLGMAARCCWSSPRRSLSACGLASHDILAKFLYAYPRPGSRCWRAHDGEATHP